MLHENERGSIEKAIATLWSEKLHEPTEEEISTHLGVNLAEIRQGLADSNRVLVSLDLMTESGHGNEGTLYESVVDEDQDDPLDVVERENLIEQMAGALENLSERERLILSLYYNDELTFKEIGKVLDLTEFAGMPIACTRHPQPERDDAR